MEEGAAETTCDGLSRAPFPSPEPLRGRRENKSGASGSCREHAVICHLAQNQLSDFWPYTGLKMNSIKAVKVGVHPWRSQRHQHLCLDVFYSHISFYS